MKIVKYIFLASVLLLGQIGLVYAASEDCSIKAAPGYYCLTKGTKPICPKGCYCPGGFNAHADVANKSSMENYCKREWGSDDEQFRNSGINRCPAEYQNSVAGAVSINMCYKTNPLAYYKAQTGVDCPNTQPAGKFCKDNAAVAVVTLAPVPMSVDCRPGCYCTGGTKKNVGALDVKKVCENKPNDNSKLLTLNAAHVYYCPAYYPDSAASATSINSCYRKDSDEHIYHYGSCPKNLTFDKDTESCIQTVDRRNAQTANESNGLTPTVNTITVQAGSYLPANADKAATCKDVASIKDSQYCPGGYFSKSNKNQGIEDCPCNGKSNNNRSKCTTSLTKKQMESCWHKTDSDYKKCMCGDK